MTSHILQDGLRVLFKEDHRVPIVSLHAWINVGSVDETPSEAGVCHVLEHMVFKGTTHHRASDISRWVESLGGSMNAETSKEYTHYYIDVPSEGARAGIHMLSELISRATLGGNEWQLECPVILEEIKRRNDDPETTTWEMLQQVIFGDAAHGRPVIGFPDTVAALTPEKIRQFYTEHYTAAQVLIVVVGDFQSDKLLARIRSDMRTLPAGGGQGRRPRVTLNLQARHQSVQKPVQQSYLAYGFPTPPADHPDQEALDLMATLLGEGRISRLVHHLREEQKLVWSIGASNVTHEGPGLFAVMAECRPVKVSAVGPAVREILNGLKDHPPTQEELRRAKNMIQTSWLQGFETFHQQAQVLGSYALERHLDRLENYLPKIWSLTVRDLDLVIERYFHQPLASVSVGPL